MRPYIIYVTNIKRSLQKKILKIVNIKIKNNICNKVSILTISNIVRKPTQNFQPQLSHVMNSKKFQGFIKSYIKIELLLCILNKQ